MTPVELTEAAGVLVALATGGIGPWYWQHRAARKASSSENLASWEGFNKSIVAERNTLKNDMKELQAAHRIEMQRVHDRHHEEIASMRAQWDAVAKEMRDRHDAEIQKVTRDLTSCRSEIAQLHGELYQLRRHPRPGP